MRNSRLSDPKRSNVQGTNSYLLGSQSNIKNQDQREEVKPEPIRNSAIKPANDNVYGSSVRPLNQS